MNCNGPLRLYSLHASVRADIDDAMLYDTLDCVDAVAHFDVGIVACEVLCDGAAALLECRCVAVVGRASCGERRHCHIGILDCCVVSVPFPCVELEMELPLVLGNGTCCCSQLAAISPGW